MTTGGLNRDTALQKPSVLNVQRLRLAGRAPATPFSILLDDGSIVQIERLLRVLPGKRIVGEGRWKNHHVLAKLFIANASARHWATEKSGIEALGKAGVPTPALLLASPLPGAGHVILTPFIENAQSLSEAWKLLAGGRAGSVDALDVLCPAFRELGRLHANGLVQDDLHLGNFLRRGQDVLIVDGDAVRAVSPGMPLVDKVAMANLALLLAQLPIAWDAFWPPLIDAYVSGGGVPPSSPSNLDGEVMRAREWRLKDFLDKTLRDCTLFSAERTALRFSVRQRDAFDLVAPIVQAPDAAVGGGKMLKDGRTSTVAQVSAGDQRLVIKRYNLKSLRHALARFWRPSRAWHAWREGHRLEFFGIATPRPLALVEERIGPMRGRAFLVTEYCPGVDLLALLSADRLPEGDIAQEIVSLFSVLHHLQISHGDLKATNLIWHAGRLFLIDLDAMQQHRSRRRYAYAWRRDRARLLRNWSESSVLYHWLDENLPRDH